MISGSHLAAAACQLPCSPSPVLHTYVKVVVNLEGQSCTFAGFAPRLITQGAEGRFFFFIENFEKQKLGENVS
jgi:hypothetical protein